MLISFSKKYNHGVEWGAEHMAQLVRHLLHKHEDQSSNPQYPYKELSIVAEANNISALEMETVGSWELTRSASLAELASSRSSEKVSQKIMWR